MSLEFLISKIKKNKFLLIGRAGVDIYPDPPGTKTENAKNELISKVLVHLDAIDFKLEDTKADVLGDAYEYLIGQFASGAGKKAGEFYTPQEVSTILAKIVTTGKTSLNYLWQCSRRSSITKLDGTIDVVSHN